MCENEVLATILVNTAFGSMQNGKLTLFGLWVSYMKQLVGLEENVVTSTPQVGENTGHIVFKSVNG